MGIIKLKYMRLTKYQEEYKKKIADKIRKEYITGKYSCINLAEKYNLSTSTISRITRAELKYLKSYKNLTG